MSPNDAGVRCLSPAQAEAWSSGTLPDPEQAAPGVWAIPSPIPAGSLPYTLSYVLTGGEGIHLVDPGWGGESALAAMEATLGRIGHSVQDVRTVIATHYHPDHLGLAGELRARSGARVLLSGTERRVLAQETSAASRDRAAYAERVREWGVPESRRGELLESFDRPSLQDDVEPDVLIADGEEIVLPGHVLRVVATPGHTDGHVCLVDADRGLLYTGDHVLPGINSGLGIGTLPGSDPLGDYFDSLDRLEPFDELRVLPGHEFRFSGLAARRAELRAHHLRRTREVAALLPELGEAPVWEYARRLTWSAGWEGLTGFLLHSALQQTALHRRFAGSERGRARLASS